MTTTTWVPIGISLMALIFTCGSFWYMNWRPGKLNVGSIRLFYAGRGIQRGSVHIPLVTLPLVFWNSGARPLLIEDLRIIPIGQPVLLVLEFGAATDDLPAPTPAGESMESNDFFFLPIALKANQIVNAKLRFEGKPDEFEFKSDKYKFELQARLMPQTKWISLRAFHLDFSTFDHMGLYNLNEMFQVYPYAPREKPDTKTGTPL